MANQQKQYFLSPTWDYPTGPSSPLAVGNIVISPSKPVPPLFAVSKLPNYESLVLDKVSETVKRDVSWSNSKSSSHNFGVWAKFLEFMGAEVGIETSRETDDVFKFESVTTQNFFPDDEFVREVLLRNPAIVRRVQKLRKAVYVVTGVKTVRGAVVKSVWKRSVGVSGSVGVDVVAAAAAAAGVPLPLLPVSALEVGPEVGTSRGKEGSSGFGRGGDDFVFAYRVLKVRVRGKGEVSQEEYVKGAMLGIPGAQDGGDLLALETLDVVQGDDDVKGFGSAAATVEEDDDGEGGEVKVFFPAGARV
ncbi:hypothetical protein QBC44DRAFT_361455 [Cladorrhinum sp. PSN332]|nr:hypothetical protein QBC44DRAFT_361455 [Cladorrhinum sp. PSN332]